MSFEQPYWLFAGLFICLLLLWHSRQFNRQQRANLARFVSPHLFSRLTNSLSSVRRRLKQALFIAGIACLFIVLARPQAGYRWEAVHRKGVEILVAVDTSKSMLTEDVKPNRLGRAKLAVDDLVNNLNGDGIGLLAFAGDSFLQCPITLDYDAFHESLNSVDTNTIPRGGTDIGGAVRAAQTVLDARPDSDKILVMITDGEDLGGDAVTAAQAAGKDGIKIFTVGVGTSSGDLIPVTGANGGTDFVKDPSGQFVKSRLDESTLRQIAQTTGGMYEPLGQEGQGLTKIYDQGLAPFTRHDLSSRRTKVLLEKFQWPLLAAFLCFTGEMLMGTRRRATRDLLLRKENKSAATARTANKWPSARAAAALAIAVLLIPSVSHASPTSAEKAYKNGDYSTAEKQYAASLQQQPTQPQLQFNLGSAAYKSGDYAKAVAAFQATLNSSNVPLQQSAYYNLGNTQFRVGQKSEQSNPQDTIKSWQEALQSYEAALQIRPDDSDAKFNHDLVKQKLERLQKQQQQKQDQQNKNQLQNQQNQQNSGQSQNQNSSNQDQKNHGQGQNSKDQQDQNAQQQNQQNGQQGKPGSQEDQKTSAQPNQQSAQNSQPKQSNSDQNKDSAAPGQPQSGQPQSPKRNGQQPDGGKNGQSQNQSHQADGNVQDEPGQMTKEEANQLLDSLKSDEHNLPAAQPAGGSVKSQDDQPLKDW